MKKFLLLICFFNVFSIVLAQHIIHDKTENDMRTLICTYKLLTPSSQGYLMSCALACESKQGDVEYFLLLSYCSKESLYIHQGGEAVIKLNNGKDIRLFTERMFDCGNKKYWEEMGATGYKLSMLFPISKNDINEIISHKAKNVIINTTPHVLKKKIFNNCFSKVIKKEYELINDALLKY